jgi:hypothetical protein
MTRLPAMGWQPKNQEEVTMPIQMPDDAVQVSSRETRPYHREAVFKSERAGFTGTEREFLDAGHGYEYDQIDPHTRREVLKGPKL